MKLYEIINPSDPYTMQAPSLEIAAAAVIALGSGKLALQGITDESEEVPLFFLGGAEAWLAEHGMPDLGAFIDAHKSEIAEALDSVLIGDANERKAFERAMAAIKDEKDRNAAREAWHDEKRSSLNDIGSYAYTLAKALRRKKAG